MIFEYEFQVQISVLKRNKLSQNDGSMILLYFTYYGSTIDVILWLCVYAYVWKCWFFVVVVHQLSFLTLTNRTLCLFGKFFGRGLVGRGPKKEGGVKCEGGISRILILVVEGRTTRSFFFENSEQENYGSFFYTFLFFNMRVV